MSITEPAWHRLVVAIARTHGWSVGAASVAHSDPGHPDLTLIHPRGRLVFAELKSDTGQVSGEQRRTLAALRDAGAPAYLWRPRDRAEVEVVLAGPDKRPALKLTSTNYPRLAATVLDVVAAEHNLGVGDLIGPSRTAPTAIARHRAMVIIRELTDLSLPAIGALFHRNHTTVIHAIRRLKNDTVCQRLCAQLWADHDPVRTGQTAATA